MSAVGLTRDDINALKAYVTAPGKNGQNQAESTVLLRITHSNLKAQFMEIRLDRHMTVHALKTKLMSHCGTNPGDMVLHLKSEAGHTLASGLQDDRMLGFYSPSDGDALHIVDTNPHSLSVNGGLEDLSRVEKYTISEDDYNKRENTYRKFREQRLQQDPEWCLAKELAQRRGQEYNSQAPRTEDPEHQQAEASGISVGHRCEVQPGGRRGEVRYVGKVEALPLGYWVGVQYDEPLGKNDGSVKGKRYFECRPNYGAFVRPDKVQVGDYPPVDEFLDSDDEI